MVGVGLGLTVRRWARLGAGGGLWLLATFLYFCTMFTVFDMGFVWYFEFLFGLFGEHPLMILLEIVVVWGPSFVYPTLMYGYGSYRLLRWLE
jgi:hypothetical protein